MGIFGGVPDIKPIRTPVTPRISDTELAAKEAANKTRARQGIEDQILTLGRKKNQPGTSSLLGRAPAEAQKAAA